MSDTLQENDSRNMLMDIEIPLSVRLGTKEKLKDILKLEIGNAVTLEQNTVELVANDKVIALGEVVVIDGYFGFKVRKICK